jgi:hypothetical protein
MYFLMESELRSEPTITFQDLKIGSSALEEGLDRHLRWIELDHGWRFK